MSQFRWVRYRFCGLRIENLGTNARNQRLAKGFTDRKFAGVRRRKSRQMLLAVRPAAAHIRAAADQAAGRKLHLVAVRNGNRQSSPNLPSVELKLPLAVGRPVFENPKVLKVGQGLADWRHNRLLNRQRSCWRSQGLQLGFGQIFGNCLPLFQFQFGRRGLELNCAWSIMWLRNLRRRPSIFAA